MCVCVSVVYSEGRTSLLLLHLVCEDPIPFSLLPFLGNTQHFTTSLPSPHTHGHTRTHTHSKSLATGQAAIKVPLSVQLRLQCQLHRAAQSAVMNPELPLVNQCQRHPELLSLFSLFLSFSLSLFSAFFCHFPCLGHAQR